MVHNKPIPGVNSDDSKHLRLTLRTLLAYLDDVLEPAQAREIGTKIQETPFASQLVDRIQEVLRRRRVAAPDLTGPGSGLDPNTVAEYLDNTLPPASVADVERVCLESDAHLAEVTACHQILTLVLGDPIHVSSESRERLHALIPQALAHQSHPERALEPASRSIPTQPASAAAAAAGHRAASRPATEAVPSSGNEGMARARTRFSQTIPDYLRPKPLWRRALVPAFVVLMLMLWLGLLIYDPSLIGAGREESDKVAQADADASKQEPVVPAVPAVQTDEKTEEKPAEETKPLVPPAPKATEKTDVEPMIEIDEKPPQDQEPIEVAANKIPPKAEEVKPIEAPEKVALAPASEESSTAEPAKTNPNEAPFAEIPPVEVVYTTKDANTITKGMLLRYNADDKEWGALPHRTRVILGEQLACPEPLDAVFSISNTDCEVTFIGGVLASFQAPKPPSAFALNLRQGKVLFTRSDRGDETVAVTVTVGDDALLLELIEPNTRCGLDILPRLPNQFEKGLGSEWYTGRLWVDSGQVRLTDRTGAKHILAGKQALDVTPVEVAEGEMPPVPTVETEQIPPDWVNPLQRNFTSQAARSMRQVYAAFNEADSESDVTTVLLPLAKSTETSPTVAVMAAKTLAMTGCLRDVADLLSLSASAPEELRMATIDGVRRWLILHPTPEDGQRLLEELRRNFHKETAGEIYRLLWGYRRSDLEDTSVANRLVDLLMDGNITVRTLAFLHLYEQTGQTNNYRPLDSESQRKTAVNRWRNDVLDGDLLD